MANPNALYDLAGDLRDVVAEVLRTVHPLPDGVQAGSDLDPMPREVCVVPGPPQWESCCSGQVTVHVENIYPTVSFPVQAQLQALVQCAVPEAAVVLVVTALRCAPVEGSGDYNGPGCAELDPVAALVLRDQYAVYRALTCLAQSWEDDDRQGMVLSSIPVPPGLCVGTETRVVFPLGDPCPCTDPVIPA